MDFRAVCSFLRKTRSLLTVEVDIGPLWLGSTNGQQVFSGYLDEVRVWAVARTGEQIRANMHAEVRSGTGLVAVFPEGGVREALHGTEVRTPVGVRTETYGVLPRDLKVPVASIPPTLDGKVDLRGEYSCAETLVLPYHAGQEGLRDAVAYFVHTDEHVYVGVEGIRPTAGSWPWRDSRPVLGHDVLLIDNWTSTVLARATTSADGEFQFEQRVPSHRLALTIPECSDCRHLVPELGPNGIWPVSVSAREVVFPECTSTISCVYRSVDFRIDTTPPVPVSAIAPFVEIVTPTSGKVIESPDPVNWIGGDADGDPVEYLVQYSPDGGQSWQGLEIVDGDATLEVELPVEDLIPGQKGVIRIVASDGVNTTVATSTGYFCVGDCDLSRPEPVESVTATPGSHDITVEWNDGDLSGPFFSGYYVYRSTTSGPPYRRITRSPVTDNRWVDQDVDPDTNAEIMCRSRF